MDGVAQDTALDWGDDEDDDDDLYNINEEQVNTFLASTSKLQISNSSVKTQRNVWGDQYLGAKSCVGSASTSESNFSNISSPYTGSSIAAPNIVSIGYPRTSNDADATVLPGFDAEAGNTWIYPINYPIREYQFNIAHQAILKNTLVSLPTGLGKTFIAAVVMYNLYRWYPTGKVIFLAPTRTLVAQQIEACFKVMGIPQEDMILMTGAVAPEMRRRSWLNKRLFFLTPQVVVNDLSRGVCPGASIRCVVVDEAHRATGGHAYCQLMESLQQHTRHTRILALSATPGVDLASVQQVVSNLFISHIELRSEDSPDIAPFTHTRVIDKVVVPLGEHLTQLRDTYFRVVRVFVMRLINMGVLYTRDETTLTKFQVLKAREACRAAPPPGVSAVQLRSAEGLFALCLTLYHALDLLLQHGARSFYNFMQATLEGDKGQSIARSELLRNREFHGLMNPLRKQYGGRGPPGHSLTGVVGTPNQSSPRLHATVAGMRPPNSFLGTNAASKLNVVLDGTALGSEDGAADDAATAATAAAAMPSSHPKMVKLLEVVKDHFEKCASEGRTTKVIIFSQYRDSVSEITELLSDLAPLVRPMSFLGQSNNSKTGRGTSQKEQIMVVKKFRAGDYNTLVSTCVGEEGLDIGEVDLIVCYDAPKSPVRLVQRMGRTGRNRQGRIVVLLTKGKEEQTYNMSQFQKRSIDAVLRNADKLKRHLYAHSPRMLPPGLEPVCQKLSMQVETYQVKVKPQKKKKAAERGIDRIKSLFSTLNARNKLVSDGGSALTSEERSWYEQHLRVSADQVKRLRSPRMLALTPIDSWLQSCANDPSSTISLGQYQPWQSSLQRHHLLPPGPLSQQLVSLTAAIDARLVDSGDAVPPGPHSMAPFVDGDIEAESSDAPKTVLGKRKKGGIIGRPVTDNTTESHRKGVAVKRKKGVASITDYFTSQSKGASSEDKRPSKRARMDDLAVEDELQVVFDSQAQQKDSVTRLAGNSLPDVGDELVVADTCQYRSHDNLVAVSDGPCYARSEEEVVEVVDMAIDDGGGQEQIQWHRLIGGIGQGMREASPLLILTPPDIESDCSETDGFSREDFNTVKLVLQRFEENRKRIKYERRTEMMAFIEMNNNIDILEDLVKRKTLFDGKSGVRSSFKKAEKNSSDEYTSDLDVALSGIAKPRASLAERAHKLLSNATKLPMAVDTPSYASDLPGKITSSTPIQNVKRGHRPPGSGRPQVSNLSTVFEETPDRAIILLGAMSSIKKPPPENQPSNFFSQNSKSNAQEHTAVTALSPILATSNFRERTKSSVLLAPSTKVSSAKQLFKEEASSARNEEHPRPSSVEHDVQPVKPDSPVIGFKKRDDGLARPGSDRQLKRFTFGDAFNSRLSLEKDEPSSLEKQKGVLSPAGVISRMNSMSIAHETIITRTATSVSSANQFKEKIKLKLSKFAAPPPRDEDDNSKRQINTFSQAAGFPYKALPSINDITQDTVSLADVCGADKFIPHILKVEETTVVNPDFEGEKSTVLGVPTERKSIVVALSTAAGTASEASAVSVENSSKKSTASPLPFSVTAPSIVAPSVALAKLPSATSALGSQIPSSIRSSEPVVNFDLSIDNLFSDDDEDCAAVNTGDVNNTTRTDVQKFKECDGKAESSVGNPNTLQTPFRNTPQWANYCSDNSGVSILDRRKSEIVIDSKKYVCSVSKNEPSPKERLPITIRSKIPKSNLSNCSTSQFAGGPVLPSTAHTAESISESYLVPGDGNAGMDVTSAVSVPVTDAELPERLTRSRCPNPSDGSSSSVLFCSLLSVSQALMVVNESSPGRNTGLNSLTESALEKPILQGSYSKDLSLMVGLQRQDSIYTSNPPQRPHGVDNSKKNVCADAVAAKKTVSSVPDFSLFDFEEDFEKLDCVPVLKSHGNNVEPIPMECDPNEENATKQLPRPASKADLSLDLFEDDDFDESVCQDIESKFAKECVRTIADASCFSTEFNAPENISGNIRNAGVSVGGPGSSNSRDIVQDVILVGESYSNTIQQIPMNNRWLRTPPKPVATPPPSKNKLDIIDLTEADAVKPSTSLACSPNTICDRSPVISVKISRLPAIYTNDAAFQSKERKKLSLSRKKAGANDPLSLVDFDADFDIKSIEREDTTDLSRALDDGIGPGVVGDKKNVCETKLVKPTSTDKAINFDLSNVFELFDDDCNFENKSPPMLKNLHTSNNSNLTIQQTQDSPINVKCGNQRVRRNNVIDSDASTANTSANTSRDESMNQHEHTSHLNSISNTTTATSNNNSKHNLNTAASTSKSNSTSSFLETSSNTIKRDPQCRDGSTRCTAKLKYGLDTSSSQGSSDEDFVRSLSTVKCPQAGITDRRGAAEDAAKFARKKSRCRGASAFLVAEAEVSRDGSLLVSSDENEADKDDQYDQSFVDDNHGNVTEHPDVDMQVVYLQSVRSPMRPPQRPPPPRTRLSRADVCSQMVDYEEDDEYGESDDSFVVDNDCVEYETQAWNRSHEDTLLMPIRTSETGSKKRKRIIMAESSSDESFTGVSPAKTNTRRRMVHFDSSSEESRSCQSPAKQCAATAASSSTTTAAVGDGRAAAVLSAKRPEQSSVGRQGPDGVGATALRVNKCSTDGLGNRKEKKLEWLSSTKVEQGRQDDDFISQPSGKTIAGVPETSMARFLPIAKASRSTEDQVSSNFMVESQASEWLPRLPKDNLTGRFSRGLVTKARNVHPPVAVITPIQCANLSRQASPNTTPKTALFNALYGSSECLDPPSSPFSVVSSSSRVSEPTVSLSVGSPLTARPIINNPSPVKQPQHSDRSQNVPPNTVPSATRLVLSVNKSSNLSVTSRPSIFSSLGPIHSTNDSSTTFIEPQQSDSNTSIQKLDKPIKSLSIPSMLQPPPSVPHQTTPFMQGSSIAHPATSPASSSGTSPRSVSATVAPPASPGMSAAPLILAGSAEISSGGGMIATALRQTHGAYVHVVTLRHGADYVLSTRMAVARLPFATWSNSSHKSRLVSRVQALAATYDRPVILVEGAGAARGGPPPPASPRSRYLDTIVCAAVQLSHLKLLHANTHSESASLLHRLTVQERARGHAIPVPPSTLPALAQRVDFFLSLPGVQHATALCLAYRFPTVARALTSSIHELQEQGKMSFQAAAALHKQLTLGFRTDMTTR